MSDQPEFDPRQLFLKEEVLDKGLEVEACEQFLTSLKPNGDSIENWTLEELSITSILFPRGSSREV